MITPHQLARELAQTVPDISQWAPYLVQALQTLENEAADLDPDHPEQFELLALEALRDAIDDRLVLRRW